MKLISKRTLKRTLVRTLPGFKELNRRFWRPYFASNRRELSPDVAALVPHIGDYKLLRDRVWLPYVMNSVYPRIETASVNTDGYGFRYVIDRDGRRLSPETGCDGPVNILLGGSTPFGVGSTSDAKTISSILARERGESWFNLSVRGFTIAQNLIQTLFLLPKLGELRQIVLLAGINDINQFFRTPIFPKLYGGFFEWMHYFSDLNPQFVTGDRISFPESFRLIFDVVENHSANYGPLQDSLRNTLTNWKFIADARGAHICFMLQPVLGWMSRDLSSEEERLLGKLGKRAAQVAQAYRQWYGPWLKAVCQDLSIDYADLNETFGRAPDSPRWLFIDDCHFTDDGSREAARLINRALGPAVGQSITRVDTGRQESFPP